MSIGSIFASVGDLPDSGYVDRKKLYVPRPGYLDGYVLLDRMAEYGVVQLVCHLNGRESGLFPRARNTIEAMIRSGHKMGTWTAFYETQTMRRGGFGWRYAVGSGDHGYLCLSRQEDAEAFKRFWPINRDEMNHPLGPELPCPTFRELKR